LRNPLERSDNAHTAGGLAALARNAAKREVAVIGMDAKASRRFALRAFTRVVHASIDPFDSNKRSQAPVGV
jgi:hypothetical protein